MERGKQKQTNKKTSQERGSLRREPFEASSWVCLGNKHSLKTWEQKIFRKQREAETLQD